MLSYQYYNLALFSPNCQLHQLLILVIYLQRNSGHAFLGMNDQDQSLPETGGGDSVLGWSWAPLIICPGAENLLIRPWTPPAPIDLWYCWCPPPLTHTFNVLYTVALTPLYWAVMPTVLFNILSSVYYWYSNYFWDCTQILTPTCFNYSLSLQL